MEEKRQAFNDNLLAAIISRSPTSGRMRYAPTVYGEKQNIKRHHPSPYPQRINGKCVGAQGHTPSTTAKWQTRELFKMELMWENLARFPRNFSPGGKTLLGFRGTFSRVGKACSVSEGHFPKRKNLAALRRNTFPGGKTLPRCAGTLSRAEKPCCVLRQHFYGHENLAALRGNTFTGMETLLRFAATLLRAWKPCCVLRQGFNDNLLATIIPCSLTSGRMRYAPTVFVEKLTRNEAIHHRISSNKW